MHYQCAGVCFCVLMTPQVYVESYSASLKNVYSLRNLKWFLVHKRFTKYKTGLAHGCNPWQSLPDLCLWGRCVQKKSCKEDKGQLKGKIRKLKKNKLRLFALTHTKINCQRNDASPEHKALLVFFSKTPVTCSVPLLLRFLSQIALLIRFKILTCKMRQRRWIWWAGDFQQ